MLRPDVPLASPEDMGIPVCVDDGPAIVQQIRKHYGEWQKQQEPDSRGR